MDSIPAERTVAVLGCGTTAALYDLDDKLTAAGFMGTALLKGILDSTYGKSNPVKRYIATVQRPESEKHLKDAFSRFDDYVEIVCGDNARALQQADTVILGIQPNQVVSVLGDASIAQALQGKLIVSMLAGVSCRTIQDILSGHVAGQKADFHVIRVTPSIGARIRESASLISKSDLSSESVAFVHWLFGTIGSTETVAEELMNTAVAVSASCHALVVSAIDAIVDGSVSRGLPRAAALKIAAQCFRGASSLLQGEMSLEELKDSMSVPRGITTEAWIELDAGSVRAAVSQTVRRAADYANKMA